MNTKFAQLLRAVEQLTPESTGADADDTVSTWYGDARRIYKVRYDARTGEAESVQRVGTQRRFFRPEPL